MTETKTAGQVFVEAYYKDRGWVLPSENIQCLHDFCEQAAQAVIAWHEAQINRREDGWQALIEQIEDEVLPPAGYRPRHEIGVGVLDAIRQLKRQQPASCPRCAR